MAVAVLDGVASARRDVTFVTPSAEESRKRVRSSGAGDAGHGEPHCDVTASGVNVKMDSKISQMLEAESVRIFQSLAGRQAVTFQAPPGGSGPAKYEL